MCLRAEQAWQGASGESPAVHDYCWSQVLYLLHTLLGRFDLLGIVWCFVATEGFGYLVHCGVLIVVVN